MTPVANQIQQKTISGHSGRFIRVGDGSPVLLVASQLVRIQPYRPLFLRLAKRFHVTVLELPGSGGGSKLRRGWNCDQYADWLAKFIEQEHFHRPLLIAHSTSAGAAMVLAGQNPGLLGGLILCGAIGIPRPILHVLLGRLLDGVIEWRLSIRRWFDVVHTSLFHTSNFFHQIGVAAMHDLRESARRITVPTLLAHGRRDHSVPLSSAHALHRLMPNSRLYISPTGSHDWLITHAEEFAELTQVFASTIGPGCDNSKLSAFRSQPLTPSPLHSPIPR